ncbi:tol-pal system protein YbgF [Rhodopseudomonas rhenobacensis]|uniref:Cell division coordinator CpoB n=1 Tax=Rhodopseudomonas rhenobacensis TaxID=87461 RepID=A0A7W7Z855_9BRAD|nr:tol-pal system protein YbgF [Rhodopseudomonas rhenobacensis]MBB5049779.1 tol-pal system protein YbgF [Rhodopseudomonas rhenobacensis]
MSSRFPVFAGGVAVAAMLALSSHAIAQSEDIDPEIRVQQLENQLRTLTGQNEELQYRNRRLEEQLKALQSAAPPPGAPQAGYPPAAAAPPSVAAVPPPAARAPVYDQQPAPLGQEQTGLPPAAAPQAGGRRRGDAFDPSQNPGAPGAPRALGSTQPSPAIAPGGRAPGEPLELNGPRGAAPGGGAAAGLSTLPPSQNPRDEFDLGIGYMQRKDYALAEQTMRNFAKNHPGDPLTADSQYWLGESFFQRQLYRDAAESFLAVTTKYDTSAKAPDALLRLGQSLAALKEKEAACAALGEVTRKYPRASGGIKQAVDREQKRIKC